MMYVSDESTSVDRIRHLSAAKRTLLARRNPLSFAQERLWFLSQLEPESPFYNVAAAMRLDGRLDIEALRSSFAEVMRRHDILRTVFPAVDGQPLQVVLGPRRFEAPVVDLEALPSAERATVAKKLVASAGWRPFDLTRGPLLRAVLVRLGEAQHVLLVALHHIICDGWSLEIFFWELFALYRGAVRGTSAGLTEPALQYADFAVWQRRRMSGEVLEGQLDYWRRQLRGVPAALDLPTDRPRPRRTTYRGRKEEAAAALGEGVGELCRAAGASPFILFLAAWSVLLRRYTGQDDIAVGSPIANRGRPELEGLIGIFLNTQVLRVDLAGDPSFEVLLERVRGTVLDAHAHQDLPFEKLVEELDLERDLDRQPLFQVLFTVKHSGRSAVELPELEVSPFEVAGRDASKFDISWFVNDAADRLGLVAVYNTDLFDSATVRRMLGHYRTLLGAVAERPGERLSRLPLLTPPERQQLFTEWNDGGLACSRRADTAPSEGAPSVERLLASRARRSADGIALVFEDRRLSYRELDRCANRLAHHLQSLGAGPEVPVAVFLERGVDLVVALLGILKAGGLYVPLDPAYPAERLGFILEDAQVPLLLTQESLRAALPEAEGGRRVVLLDSDREAIGRWPATGPDHGAASRNLAYVIYTSGSTGRPKGVAIERHSVLNLLLWAGRAFPSRHLDGMLASTSVCFDLSVFEIFTPLVWGGRVIMVQNALELASLDNAGEVRLINTVPSAMAALVEEKIPDTGRIVNLAGEALDQSLVDEIYRRGHAQQVVNLYAPSETTTYSTVAPQRRSSPRSPDIGRPLANTRLAIVGPDLAPLPVGVPGELLIGGAGVTRGYLRRPALTAARYIPDPFAHESGSRLYRTGDLVRYLSDGRADFLGRIDRQVKIRGFRIELGEIESVLACHSAVDAVVVAAREAAPGDQRLVAYVVSSGRSAPARELRDHLAARLPAYMVPAYIVDLAELPLTPNGKVDHRSLPAPWDDAENREPAEPEASPIAEILTGIWSSVLGTPGIGIDDSFFANGGHSLLATRVMSRVRAVFGAELPVRTLFEAPTVRSFARRVESARRRGASAAEAIEPVPRDAPLPLSFAQSRLWFLDQLEPGSPAYNLPAGVRFRGSLDLAALAASLGQVVERQESLRTVFRDVDGEPVQVIGEPGPVELPVTDLSGLGPEERQRRAEELARAEARGPFELGRGPLLRVRVLRLAAEDHIVLTTLHHIITDGWSMGILSSEIAACYAALRDGRKSELEPLPVQYGDYAVWQRRRLAGEVLLAELDFWRDALRGAPAILELPTDFPRPETRAGNGDALPFELPEEVAEKLRNLGQRHGATLFMTLLAAFQTFLARYSGHTDLTVGTPIAGRDQLDTEGIIGFFANTLVVRADLSGDLPFQDYLGRVREVCLDAYTHQEVPFEKLVEELDPERHLSYSPLFQAFFTLQNLEHTGVEVLPELEMTPFAVRTSNAKFDLSLTVVERPARGGLGGSFEFSMDLFESSTIARLGQRFETLVRGVADTPAHCLSELATLDSAERLQLLAEWSRAGEAVETGTTVGGDADGRVDESGDATAMPVTAPKTRIEEVLAGIWAELLRRDDVGPESNFFHLGGHSLLATRMLSRLRRTLGVEILLRSVFETPTLGEFARRVEGSLGVGVGDELVAGHRRDLPPIVPTPRDRPLPLSFAQERLWFIDRLEPGRATYNMPQAIHLEGSLRAEALRWALSEIVRRHEVLRTVLAVHDEDPEQEILPAAPFPLAQVDLSGLPGGLRGSAAQRLAADAARRPFDLARGPLFRVTLVRLGEHEHLLLSTLHHVASDGWSMGILRKELAALYEAAGTGRPSPLPELPVQYADYAVWQRRFLDTTRGELLAWWREQLAGSPALLELPTDRPRPAVWSGRGESRSFSVREETVKGLRELTLDRRATFFMALLSAFAAILGRYASQRELNVGAPIAGRRHLELEGLIGFFVNTLVLRVGLEGDPSFAELLDRVRETTLAAYTHQDLPFEHLVEELAPERSLGHSPLFQVTLTLQNTPRDTVRMAHRLEARPWGRARRGTAKYDLALRVADSREGLHGSVEYASDLFDATTVQRLLGHFTALLAAAADRGRRLSELPLLAAAERQQLQVEWNETRDSEAREACFHELFREQAERVPEAVALVCEERRWSYRELDRRSDLVARRLVERGVGAEVTVGLCAERSPEAVAGLLGVLKAGGAYVPLDPRFPAPRLAYMLEDSGASLVLCQEHLGDLLPADEPPVLFLDGSGALSPEVEGGPLAGGSPGQLAYVIYTSGSSGRPKGVGVEHRQVASYVRGLLAHPRVPVGGAFAIVSTPATDLGNTSIFAALASGGSLHLISEDRIGDGEAMADYCGRHRVDALKIVPSHLAALLAFPGCRDLLPRRCLILGGESASWELVAKVRALAPGCRVLNHYGPTETTVGVLTCPLDDTPREGAVAAQPAPIGRPMAETRLYVATAGLVSVPPRAPAQGYIGGAHVARGYVGRPRITAERFVPDPFGSESGGRLYCTGDRLCFGADGRVQFLGRLDHQVKIRGFRIELGEVESVLERLPEVRQAVVMAREGAAGSEDLRLTAWVVLREDVQATSAPLRAHLGKTLPDYMLPSVWVFPEKLPLLPNGKLDRTALSREALPAPEVDEGAVAPQGPVEEMVAGIWAQVLGRERPGRNDDFFASGGHSLLITQVAARLRKAFGVEIPVLALFEAPTIAELGARVEEELFAGHRTDLPPIGPAPRDRPLPLSFAQERLWFIDRLEPGQATYNMPQAIRLIGPLRPDALRWALGEIVRRHEVLRTVLAVHEEAPVQVVLPAAPFPLAQIDLSGLTEARRAAAAARLSAGEARRPFDLARGPLFRVTLVRLGEEEHLLLSTMHHVASDGWSMGILRSELTALYDASVSGSPSPLAELPVQYADYAVWQRRCLTEARGEQLAWWREQLAGSPALHELPTDRPRPAVWSGRGASQSFAVPEATVEGLRELTLSRRGTLFMTLLSAFAAVLARCASERDLNVGAPIAGRRQLELEGLIGFFVNTLVLRVRLEDDPSFAELLDRVRETTLAAFTHQDLPFEHLVEALAPERSLAHTPLFQVTLTLQNTPRETVQIAPRLEARPWGKATRGTAKFDLALTLMETGKGLNGALEYASDLFDTVTIRRLSGQLLTLLDHVAADPECRPSELTLLSAAARQQALLERNDTARRLDPRNVCERFAARAARHPDKVAIRFEAVQMSYRQLELRSDRLACRLRRSGVVAETLVGIALEPGPELPVALLAVWKAGGAYLPLDPAYPRNRLAYMLADSAAAVVVTESALARTLPARSGVTVCVDRDQEAAAAGKDESPGVEVPPDALAYVIYTSGSTGRPKGVAVTHRNLANFLAAMRQRPGLVPADRLLAVTSLSFDISGLELFLPLTTGAEVELVSRSTASDGERLAAALAGATVFQATPSTWRLLVAADWRDRAVKALCGGEALTPELAHELVARTASTWNMYGPTEATIWSAVEAVSAGVTPSVPLGRPIDNTSFYVVDGALRPQPAGVAGELVIGGAGLARGYLGRPGLTAERFVPDAWGPGIGRRLYRTGDRVAWHPDGRLEFFARLDHQVKVRGYRIELGEVESVLEHHPDVRQAVVMAREGAAGSADLRLVAWVARRERGQATSAQLRAHLGRSLPDYMVPSDWVFPESLPLLPNGKVDRGGLPEPGRDDAVGAAQAPRSLAELRLVRIWEDLLGIEPVGVEESFFTLGGHSLLAVRLQLRIEQLFGQRLPVASLFQSTTVRQQTELLRRGERLQPPRALVTLRPSGASAPLFFVHPASGHAIGYYSLSRHLGPEQPFYAFQSIDLEGGAPGPQDVEGMAELYLGELRAVQPLGPYRLGGHSMGGVVAFEMARRLREEGQEVALLALLDTWAPDAAAAGLEDTRLLRSFALSLGFEPRTLSAPELEVDTPETSELLRRLFARAQELSLIDSEVDRNVFERLWQVFRRNFQAMHTYSPRGTYGGRTLLLVAESAAGVPDRGWGPWVGDLDVRSVPGTHHTMVTEPRAGMVAEVLRQALHNTGKACLAGRRGIGRAD